MLILLFLNILFIHANHSIHSDINAKVNSRFIYVCFILCINLLQINTLYCVATVNTDSSIEEEWWIEVEITCIDGKQETNDEILLLLYEKFLQDRRDYIESWHFFREPTLRFRIELTDNRNRNTLAAEIKDFLDSVDLVKEHYFARHGQRIENFSQGYAGEQDQYKDMWPYQKKLWEWGSEMTVAAIKEYKKTGANDPSREYQLERIFHLLSNQLSPGYEIRKIDEYSLQWKCIAIIAVIYAVAVSMISSIKIRKISQSKS